MRFLDVYQLKIETEFQADNYISAKTVAKLKHSDCSMQDSGVIKKYMPTVLMG